MPADAAAVEATADWLRKLTGCLTLLCVCLVPAAVLFSRRQGLPSGGLIEGTRDVLLSRPSAPLADGGSPLAQAAADGAVPTPSPPSSPPPSCSLPVKQSVFAKSCTLLEDVCVDQATAILYSPRHRPEWANGPPIDLPVLVPTDRQSHFYLQYWHADGVDMTTGLPSIHVRPASAQESRPYLAEPVFSTCTVPVVYYGHHSNNYVHSMRDNAGRFYSALLETAWAEHVKIVLMTGEGLNISRMNQDLWQPLSKLRVDSWADFTVRLTGEQAAGGGPFPPSYEGSEQRCFKNMFVCTHDIATAAWQLHGYGQYLARYYHSEQLVKELEQQQQPAQPAVVAAGQDQQQPGQQQPEQLLPPESVLRQLGTVGHRGKAAGRGKGGRGSGSGEVELRIVFHKRDGVDRQLANAPELLEACNKWRYTAPMGAHVRARCWQVELPNLAAGIAAAQQADIFVGVHGANIANAWLMRPGSSVVEVVMHEFEENQAHNNFAKRNLADAGTQIQFWKMLLCDPDHSWQPGSVEAAERAAGATSGHDWPKYRNSFVRWEALETIFKAIVHTGGDMQQYKGRWVEGRWWWLSTAKATVYAGPNTEFTCRKARNSKLIA